LDNFPPTFPSNKILPYEPQQMLGFFAFPFETGTRKVFRARNAAKVNVSERTRTGATVTARTTYGVKDLCDRFNVGEHTVLGWIRRGELQAINVARKPTGRPKWRVTPEAIAAFELNRCPAETTEGVQR
jgi:Helix-turn-helix domain